ncbi:MAG: hypothetical protein AAB225_23425 [Acidobacteriota bacterium]
MRWLDLIMLAAYLAGMAWIGVRFARRQTSTETYFTARRSIPWWAVGMSMMATLVSSVTFVGYPGSSYGKDWSLLVPGFLVVGVLAITGAVLIPFYREAVRMSAYEYFGQRFGHPTRLYASAAFSLGHFGKMAFIYYLVALTAHSMTGWSLDATILLTGAVTVFYTVIGGIEAVIWTDVVQGFIMWAGIIVCLAYLLFLPPGGPAAVFAIAADQTLVQRYLEARSDRAALKGISFGALLTLPVWTLFMLIGACTWAFYRLTGEKLPAYITKADQVFPHSLSTHIPPGMAGIFMA